VEEAAAEMAGAVGAIRELVGFRARWDRACGVGRVGEIGWIAGADGIGWRRAGVVIDWRKGAGWRGWRRDEGLGR
jgi:hypothetical protein